MWKRDEAVKAPQPSTPVPTPVTHHEPAAPRHEPTRLQEKEQTVNIGKSVIIKGDLSGSEDLTIEGAVEGKIELRQNILTIGPNAKIKAQIFAKAVVIQGEVHGNVTATEKVDIRDAGSVDGDLSAPRVAIADGAHFRGSIDMQSKTAGAKPTTDARPQPTPAATSGAPAAGTPATTAR